MSTLSRARFNLTLAIAVEVLLVLGIATATIVAFWTVDNDVSKRWGGTAFVLAFLAVVWIIPLSWAYSIYDYTKRRTARGGY